MLCYFLLNITGPHSCIGDARQIQQGPQWKGLSEARGPLASNSLAPALPFVEFRPKFTKLGMHAQERIAVCNAVFHLTIYACILEIVTIKMPNCQNFAIIFWKGPPNLGEGAQISDGILKISVTVRLLISHTCPA